MALDQYAAAKTADQRAAVVEFLQHFDQKLVAESVVDHIIASRNGTEATVFNELIAALNPGGCATLLDRLGKTDGPVAKGKLIVALRHCQSRGSLKALGACLNDKRSVPFEARGPNPRRVCDLAYDELYIKLRGNPLYGLDATPRMKGFIYENTPPKGRDTLIAKLKARLAKYPPAPVPSAAPSPSATPEQAKPATAAITLL
jgi:hypothetical protein